MTGFISTSVQFLSSPMNLRVYVSFNTTNDNYHEHDICIQTFIVICLVIVYIVGCMLYILPDSES